MEEAEKFQQLLAQAQEAIVSWFIHSLICAKTKIGQFQPCNDFWLQVTYVLMVIGAFGLFLIVRVLVKDWLHRREVNRRWAYEQQVNVKEIEEKKWIEEDPAPDLEEKEVAARIKQHIEMKKTREANS